MSSNTKQQYILAENAKKKLTPDEFSALFGGVLSSEGLGKLPSPKSKDSSKRTKHKPQPAEPEISSFAIHPPLGASSPVRDLDTSKSSPVKDRGIPKPSPEKDGGIPKPSPEMDGGIKSSPDKDEDIPKPSPEKDGGTPNISPKMDTRISHIKSSSNKGKKVGKKLVRSKPVSRPKSRPKKEASSPMFRMLTSTAANSLINKYIPSHDDDELSLTDLHVTSPKSNSPSLVEVSPASLVDVSSDDRLPPSQIRLRMIHC
ncbi:hypothetical protein GEMRC1_010347 [Eukaryota sp. GEM-RC1]